MVYKGCGTLMTSLYDMTLFPNISSYKDYALKLEHLSFELTFPNLNSSKIAFPGFPSFKCPVLLIQTAPFTSDRF